MQIIFLPALHSVSIKAPNIAFWNTMLPLDLQKGQNKARLSAAALNPHWKCAAPRAACNRVWGMKWSAGRRACNLWLSLEARRGINHHSCAHDAKIKNAAAYLAAWQKARSDSYLFIAAAVRFCLLIYGAAEIANSISVHCDARQEIQLLSDEVCARQCVFSGLITAKWSLMQ